MREIRSWFMAGDATQDRFLGAILGMAIGDAFGMPVAGLSPTTIADIYGTVRDYLPRTFADGEAINPGEITDETEFALCIIESITAGQGTIDVENIGVRMAYLARSDSRRWMSADVASNLDGPSEESGYRLALCDDAPAGPDVLARGIPLGLLHSMGAFDDGKLATDVDQIVRITHSGPMALTLVDTVARAVNLAVRADVELRDLPPTVADQTTSTTIQSAIRAGLAPPPASHQVQIPAATVLAQAVAIAAEGVAFEDVLQRSVALGGAADARAALAASLYAGHHGSAVIPQRLIDNLEARIYVSLAVPWYYRTVAKRSGRLLDLRRMTD